MIILKSSSPPTKTECHSAELKDVFCINSAHPYFLKTMRRHEKSRSLSMDQIDLAPSWTAILQHADPFSTVQAKASVFALLGLWNKLLKTLGKGCKGQ